MSNAVLDRQHSIGNNGRPMDIIFAVLADSANVSQEGKMNILGNFASISATNYPTVHLQMYLVLRMEASPTEIGMKKNVEVAIIDIDGERIASFSADFEIPEGRGDGEPIGMQTILSMQNTVFPKPGRYAVDVLVNQDRKITIPLALKLVEGGG